MADHVLSWSASKEVACLGGVDGGGGGPTAVVARSHGDCLTWTRTSLECSDIEQQEQRQQQTIDATLRPSSVFRAYLHRQKRWKHKASQALLCWR